MIRFSRARAVVFDLDGTLIDSVPDLALAVDLMLADLNYPKAGESRVRQWIGNGANLLVKRALTWAQEGFVPELPKLRSARELFDLHYSAHLTTESRLYAGVLETLSSLKQQNMPMGIVTNKPSAFIHPILEQLGLSEYFSFVLGGDDVVVRKPHPAGLYLALGTLGLLPHELVFVGDSDNDIKAAKAAGCLSVGLSYGYNYGESIALSEPDLVLDKISDLLPVLGITR